MKVGVLTFHRAANFGAVLQAYALEKVIRQLGDDCELIDYRNKFIEEAYKPIPIRKIHNFRSFLSAFLRSGERYWKRGKFRDFISEQCRTSPIVKKENLSSLQGKYDVVITGSDQVWNFNLTGGDFTFFLEFLGEEDKRASYAASITETNYTNQQLERIKKDLQLFSAISVREDFGQKYLASIGVWQNIDIVLDPTLLLTREEWNQSFDWMRFPKNPGHYLLAYFVSSDKSCYDRTLKLARQLGLKAVFLQDFFHRRAKGFVNIRMATPAQFVWLFQHANYVVTDSFHGVSFSINFSVDFTYILNTKIPEKNDRILTLIKALDLESRDYDKEEFGPIENWDKVQRKLSVLREKSLQFLTDKVLI